MGLGKLLGQAVREIVDIKATVLETKQAAEDAVKSPKPEEKK